MQNWSENSRQILEVLRNPEQTFSWYIIPLLLIVMYIYSKEAHKGNWNIFLGGLALFGMDLFNETWNTMVFYISGYAPVWGTPGDSALVILPGWNIEILFMFAIMGIVAAYTLPEDKQKKILGIPNRWFLAVLLSVFAVAVECLLNLAGALTWDYAWWDLDTPWLIFLIGYLPFFVVCFLVHDMQKIKNKIYTLCAIYGVDTLLLITAGSNGWL